MTAVDLIEIQAQLRIVTDRSIAHPHAIADILQPVRYLYENILKYPVMVENDKEQQATGKAAVKMPETIKHPKQDYSELPQKPITLKKGMGGLASQAKTNLETAGKTSAASTAAKPRKQWQVKRKRQVRDQWVLRGVSQSARDAATKAAKAEGVKLSEWLDHAILRMTTPPVESNIPQQQLLDALQDIRNRLERIEYQQNVLSRFWDWLKSRAGW